MLIRPDWHLGDVVREPDGTLRASVYNHRGLVGLWATGTTEAELIHHARRQVDTWGATRQVLLTAQLLEDEFAGLPVRVVTCG